MKKKIYNPLMNNEINLRYLGYKVRQSSQLLLYHINSTNTLY
jgi:hypothetical protein